MKNNPPLSLVILAAWMWSRYGWLKQIDEFWPHGESLLEYAVYDALQAWFEHIVLIIRESFEEAFREKFAQMMDACPKVSIVFQDLDPHRDNPEYIERQKPWWTLHATLTAAEVVDGPFAVVNADDWYGTRSYQLIADHLRSITSQQAFLVWYVLWNTLSKHGTVNRGVCKVADNKLVDVVETYAIWYVDEKIVDKKWDELVWDEIVSMNFRWFHQDYFEQATPLLQKFMNDHAQEPKAEMTIPDVVDVLIHIWVLSCEVITSPDPRQWVTNAEDKPRVQEAFTKMREEWLYPEKLWRTKIKKNKSQKEHEDN